MVIKINNTNNAENDEKDYYFKSKFKVWMKVIALVVVVCFLWEQVVYAQGGTPAFLTQKTSGRVTQKDLDSFKIPANIGSTRQIHKTESDETIIHIQDAHDSLTAQESIVKILENLVTNYDLKLIAQEGSTGYIDTSLLSTFPIESVKKKTAQHFMEQGMLSAAEFYSICSKKDKSLERMRCDETQTFNLQNASLEMV